MQKSERGAGSSAFFLAMRLYLLYMETRLQLRRAGLVL